MGVIMICLAVLVVVLGLAQGADVRAIALEKHNAYRRRHGVPAMRWHSGAAAHAQKWCDYLARTGNFKHSSGSGYGENLYYQGGSWGSQSATERASDSWYAEEKYYNYNGGGFSMRTGHFTQMVWKSSTGLGCAESTRGRKTYVCCNYSPPGNFRGRYRENVLRPR